MYNNFVSSYCNHHNLEILKGVLKSYVVIHDKIIAEFKNNEKLITFFNSDGTVKMTIKKGDLALFMLEESIAH